MDAYGAYEHLNISKYGGQVTCIIWGDLDWKWKPMEASPLQLWHQSVGPPETAQGMAGDGRGYGTMKYPWPVQVPKMEVREYHFSDPIFWGYSST